jgi:hypothetical protein
MTPARVNKDIRFPIEQRLFLCLCYEGRALRKIETLLLFSPFLTTVNTLVSVSVSQSVSRSLSQSANK